jgi:hypothetical protein
MFSEFSEIIEATIIFLSILQVLESIHSWIDHVEPKRWAQAHDEAVQILKWMVWSIVESPQDLVRSEGVSMMV